MLVNWNLAEHNKNGNEKEWKQEKKWKKEKFPISKQNELPQWDRHVAQTLDLAAICLTCTCFSLLILCQIDCPITPKKVQRQSSINFPILQGVKNLWKQIQQFIAPGPVVDRMVREVSGIKATWSRHFNVSCPESAQTRGDSNSHVHSLFLGSQWCTGFVYETLSQFKTFLLPLSDQYYPLTSRSCPAAVYKSTNPLRQLCDYIGTSTDGLTADVMPAHITGYLWQLSFPIAMDFISPFKGFHCLR